MCIRDRFQILRIFRKRRNQLESSRPGRIAEAIKGDVYKRQGGIIVPFIGIKAIDMFLVALHLA